MKLVRVEPYRRKIKEMDTIFISRFRFCLHYVEKAYMAQRHCLVICAHFRPRLSARISALYITKSLPVKNTTSGAHQLSK